MKRYIFKLSFVPKIPIPHVILDNTFNYDGSFFLISEKPLILTDFSISDSTEFKDQYVHVSHGFEIFLNSEEMDLISVTHAHFSKVLLSNMDSSFYNEYMLYLIPVMKSQDQNEWCSTLEWVKRFTDPPSISKIYHEILVRFDRKNQGAKLGSFFMKHGEWVNRFVRFVISLEKPIKEFIRSNPVQNNHEITRPELVALFSAVKLQELLIDRITKKERSRRNQYSIIRSVSFNLNFGILNESKNNYIQKLECEDTESYQQYIPLLDITNINRNSSTEYFNYHSLATYPSAVSRGHQRILELLENRDLIQQVFQRIPENYIPPEPMNLHPMDLSYLSPVAPIHLSIAPLLHRISDQFYPILKGHMSIMNATISASDMIHNNFLYRFKDLRLLRMALSDSSLVKLNRKSIPTNSRLAILGDSVLNFIISNIIFLSNPKESVIKMTKMRSLIQGGEFFCQISNKINLSKFFFSSHGSLSNKLPNHTARKLIQALFGAIFLDSNLSSCFTAFKYMVMTDNKSIAESMFFMNPLGPQTLELIAKTDFNVQNDLSSTSIGGASIASSSKSSGNLSMSLSGSLSNLSGSSSISQLNNNGLGGTGISSNNNMGGSFISTSFASILSSLMNEYTENYGHPIKYQNVYDAIKISFPANYIPLFQAAFTNSTCSKSYTCNERLSFVGEAFTKMIITLVAYRCFPACDSDQLEYVIYVKIREIGLIAFDKQISTITVVQPGYEDRLAEPVIDDDNAKDALSSLHAETLFAVVAAIAFACGCNAACQFIHQDILGLDWFNEINFSNFEGKELEEKIKQKSGLSPHYFQFLVDGRYFTLMSIGGYRVRFVGVAKDPILSKQDLINAVVKAYENDPSIVLTQKEYEDLDMTEPTDECPQLQYNIFD